MPLMERVTLDEFGAAHDSQLKGLNFPMNLKKSLFEQITSQGDRDLSCLSVEGDLIVTNRRITKGSKVFVFDHIWTSDGSYGAYHDLQKDIVLADKLADMFNVPDKIDVASMFCYELEAKSLAEFCSCGYNLAKEVLQKQSGDLVSAAIELSVGKPCIELTETKKDADIKCSFEEFKIAMLSAGYLDKKYDVNDDYIHKMYKSFLKQGDGSGITKHYNWLEDDSEGIISVYVSVPTSIKKTGILSKLTNKSWSLVVNGSEVINGELGGLVKVDECYWSIESPGVFCMTLEKVNSEGKWKTLINGEIQLSSTEVAKHVWAKDVSRSMYLQSILDKMWYFNQTYSLLSSNGKTRKPVWYVMDTSGRSFQHSDTPNMKCSPFLFVPKNQAFTIMWPLEDIAEGSVLTRNFIPQIMQNETLPICKARLDAFANEDQSLEILSRASHFIGGSSAGNSETCRISFRSCEVGVDSSSQVVGGKSVWSPVFLRDLADKRLPFTLCMEKGVADAHLLNLDEVHLIIDSEVFFASDVFSNLEYAKTYFRFVMDSGNPDLLLLSASYFLPNQLVEFHDAMCLSSSPLYWICRPVDRGTLQLLPLVSSHYARLARLCEAGAVVATKYIPDQPVFQKKRFSLLYSVVIDVASRDVFIYGVPTIQLCKDAWDPAAFVNEYDSSATLPVGFEISVASQDGEFYKDFQIAMDQILLRQSPGLKWVDYQERVFKAIGNIGKAVSSSMQATFLKPTVVLFGAHVILDEAMRPFITDVCGRTTLPNIGALTDVVALSMGVKSHNFACVL